MPPFSNPYVRHVRESANLPVHAFTQPYHPFIPPVHITHSFVHETLSPVISHLRLLGSNIEDDDPEEGEVNHRKDAQRFVVRLRYQSHARLHGIKVGGAPSLASPLTSPLASPLGCESRSFGGDLDVV